MGVSNQNNLLINIDLIKNNFDVKYGRLEKFEKIAFKYNITNVINEIFLSNKKGSRIASVQLIFHEDKSWTVVLTKKNKEEECYTHETLPSGSKLRELVKKIENVIDLVTDKDQIIREGDNNKKSIDQFKGQLDKKSMISRIYRAIQRWYFSTFILPPALKALKKSFFANVSSEVALKKKWDLSERIILDEIDRLYKENLVPKENITKEELYVCMSKELEGAYSTRCQQLTGKILSEQERRFLRNEKIIDEATAYFKAIDPQNQQSKLEAEQNWVKTVDAIPATDFPFDKLAKVPITPVIKQCLIDTWNRLFVELVEKGNLRHILDEKKQQLLDEHTDFISIISKIKDNNSEFLRALAKEIISKYNLSLDEAAQLKLTEENLIPILIAEIEQLGIREYHLTNEQIVRLRLFREGFGQGDSLLTDAEILIGEVTKSSKKSKEVVGKDFTEFEVKGLQILTKVLAHLETIKTEQSKKKNQLSKEIHLSGDEKKLLQEFMKYIRESSSHKKALNGKIREIIEGKQTSIIDGMRIHVLGATITDDRKYKHLPFGISLGAAELVARITYELKDEDQFERLANKLELLLKKIKNKQPIAPSEQMTLTELGILEKCAKVGRKEDQKLSLLKVMQEIDFEKQDVTIDGFSGLSTRVEALLDELNQAYQNEVSEKSIKKGKNEREVLADSFYKPGDFVAVNGYRQLLFHGRKPTSIEEMHFRLVTPYSHGAKIFTDKQDRDSYQTKISEVLGAYSQREYQFFDDMYSEVWRLNISAMIPKNQHQNLKKVYGENWAQIIQKKYEAFENLIHKNKKKQFSELQNPWERRLSAGKADYLWGGHVRQGENDFQKLAHQILGDSKAEEDRLTEMICSEFVTKTTLTALVKLNEELSGIIGEKNILELPVSKKEDLNTVHPGRMIDLFKKRNCISKVDKPKIISQIIREI